MAPGRVAMTSVGFSGPDVRSDVRVEVEDSERLSVEVTSSVEAMYGQSILDCVNSVAAGFGDPPVRLKVVDSGALPFVLAARVESALSAHLGSDVCVPTAPPRKPRRDRLRRTRLYVPGNSPKFFPNAALFKPDGIIFDLEDSVPADQKVEARRVVCHALAALDFETCEVMARVNSGVEGLAEVRDLARLVDCFLLPKVESPDDVLEVARNLDGADSPALLIPLLETALGFENAFEIARCHNRIVALAIGLEDYLADIGAVRSESGVEAVWAHGRLVNAARAANVSPLASVYPNLEDDEGLWAYVSYTKRLGLEGVGCIHPRQIAVAHKAFAPSAEETESAKRIVEAFESSVSRGIGAVRVEGKMVDAPVYRRAVRTLELACS